MSEPIHFLYPDACMIVFARAPQRGKVKTRLAAGIGDEAALAVYRRLLRHTLETLADSRLAPVEMHVAGSLAHPDIRALAMQTRAGLVAQRGADLGERMHYAIDRALQTRERVLLVGSDCPVLDKTYLKEAFQRLAGGSDVVIGPGEDGGYVLIGATRIDPRIFRDILWGSDTVMAETRRTLQRANMNFHELDTLWDIDRPEDYRRWQSGGATMHGEL